MTINIMQTDIRTVRDLINLLNTLPDDMPVVTPLSYAHKAYVPVTVHTQLMGEVIQTLPNGLGVYPEYHPSYVEGEDKEVNVLVFG